MATVVAVTLTQPYFQGAVYVISWSVLIVFLGRRPVAVHFQGDQRQAKSGPVRLPGSGLFSLYNQCLWHRGRLYRYPDNDHDFFKHVSDHRP